MAKAIITINDDDAEAPNGFSIEVTFDPPLPTDKEERLKMKPPKCGIIAMKMIDLMGQLAEAEGFESESRTQH